MARLPSLGSFDLSTFSCLVLLAMPAAARAAAVAIVAEATLVVATAALAVAAAADIARFMQPSLASIAPALG